MILNATASMGTPRACDRPAGMGRRRRSSSGYLLSSVLRFGLGSLPPLLGLTLTTDHEDLVVRVFGCSYGNSWAMPPPSCGSSSAGSSRQGQCWASDGMPAQRI